MVGRPEDILQAAAGSNGTLPAGSQHELDAESKGKWVPGRARLSWQVTCSLPSCPLHFLGLAQDHFLPTLFFALSPFCNFITHSALLSGECHCSWHTSRQTGTFLLAALCVSIETKHLRMLYQMILDRTCFVQQGE